MSTLTNAKTMVNALRNAGIEIPKSVDAASKQSQLMINNPNTVAAEKKVAAATDQKSMDAAVNDLALAMVLADTTKDGRLTATVNRARERAFTDAFYPLLPEFYDQICERFNAVTEPFSEAVSRIPDISGLGPLDISPEASAALLDAKAAVRPLNALWTAYNAVARVSGLPG